MRQSEYTTSSGRKIYVFRDVYDYQRQLNLLDWCVRQPYTFRPANEGVLVGLKSDLVLSAHPNLDASQLGEQFELHSDSLKPIKETIGPNRELKAHWINANVSKTSPNFHPDSFREGSLSMLYYANVKWDLSWDGYTVWASDDLKSIEHVEFPEPGKVVIFDSSIPHKPTAASPEAPSFRYTMNSVWELVRSK